MKRNAFVRGLVRELAASRGDCSPGSFMNCHAIGLHSIVLRESPMVRMFVTTPDHELWRKDDGIPATLAFHSHRTDLRLETLRGSFFNCTFGKGDPASTLKLSPFRWDSKINGGAGRFTRCGAPMRTGRLEFECVEPGRSVTMAAAEIHTVLVVEGAQAAWLVTEGEADPAYDPTSYSHRDLSAFEPAGLYRPMTRAEAARLIAEAVGT